MKKYILLGLVFSVALFSSTNVFAKDNMVKIEVVNQSARTLDYVRIMKRGGIGNIRLFGFLKKGINNLNSGATWTGEVEQDKLRIKEIEVEYKRKLNDINHKYQLGKFVRPMNLTKAKNIKCISIYVWDKEIELRIRVGKK